MKKIVGYSDKISAVPGDTIRFMMSCDGPTSYRADLVRIIHGDLNPEGPGFKEKVIAGVGGDEHRGRKQEVYAGSHVLVPDSPSAVELRLSEIRAPFRGFACARCGLPSTPWSTHR